MVILMSFGGPVFMQFSQIIKHNFPLICGGSGDHGGLAEWQLAGYSGVVRMVYVRDLGELESKPFWPYQVLLSPSVLS